MLRFALAFALVCGLLLVGGLSSIIRIGATQSPGEYWRLPWKANVGHNVSGNGYGEGTHDGDRILDGVEVKSYNTNPLSTNGDGDGCGDGKEIGSVNNDTAVDILDLQIIAAASGSAPGPPYVTDFDLTKDGVINVLDLQLDAKLAGNLCP